MLNRNKRTIPDDLAGLFKQLFLKEYGLSLGDHIYESFKSVLFERMDRLRIKSPYDYYNFLENSTDGIEEKCKLIDQITVGETYFFRNRPQINTLTEKILPELIHKKLLENDRTIKIWSAGCSEGDEPYTIAIIVKELLPDYENWDISILATDINRTSIAKAEKGIYGQKSVKHIPEDYLENYFKESKGRYHLCKKIKDMVTFEYHNLSMFENIIPEMLELDVIFCRNVTIYFDLSYTKKLINLFYRLLKYGGVMFLGHSETLFNISDKFTVFEYKKSFVYKKGKVTESTTKRQKLYNAHKSPSGTSIDEALRKIRKKRVTDKVKSVYIKNQKDKTKADSTVKEKKVSKIIHKRDVKPEIVFSEKFEQAVKTADAGRCRDAIEILKNLLKVNNLHIETYYLLGILSNNLKEYSEAEKHFRKVLYTDPESAMAHFNLAEIYLKQNTIDKSVKEYKNAIKILKDLSPEDHLRFSEDYTADFLLKVCEKKLSKIKN
jgi:chemotaxis protein methyltransferase CheR